MTTIVFDVETTGLIPKKGPGFDNYWPFSNLDKFNNSRITSICWKVFNKDNFCIETHYYVVKPKDFVIDNDSVATNINGITKEIAEKGVDIELVFEQFERSLKDCSLLIAHNIVFDKAILSSEMYRYQKQDLLNKFRSIETFCTCYNGKDITKIKIKGWRDYKIPKLSELYEHLFKKEFENAHNAEFDVSATAQCYFKMKDLI